MTSAELLAARLADELTHDGHAATAGPAAGDYGWKVRLQGVGGAVVVYAGKKGSRLVLTELQSPTSEVVSVIQRAWGRVQAATAAPAAQPLADPPQKPSLATSVDLWVDGSYVAEGERSAIGWAALIVEGEQELYRAAGSDVPEEARSQRNVAGEIVAVRNGLSWCQEHGLPRISLYHDYEGLEAWVTGRWQARNPFTTAYARFVRECGIVVQWQKVRAHTGNPRNEQVDQMARQAATAGLRLLPGLEGPATPQPGDDRPPRCPSRLLLYARHLKALASRWTHYGGAAEICWDPLQAALTQLRERFAPAEPLSADPSPDPHEWARLAGRIVDLLEIRSGADPETAVIHSPKE